MLLETENPNIEEVYGETPLKKKKKKPRGCFLCAFSSQMFWLLHNYTDHRGTEHLAFSGK